MKVFISLLITGMEPIRAAARAAVQGLGYEPKMAEDFVAMPTSPQVACLEGVRQSGLVILILGKDYGWKQPSGISATHEEYREARGNRPVIAFVQDGVDRDPDEKAFAREVEEWEGGLFRGGFTTPEDLQVKIGRAVHEYMMSRAAGPVDGAALLDRAISLLPKERRGYSSGVRHLAVAVACGPAQDILRPSQIEDRGLAEHLAQSTMFGPARVLDRAKGVSETVEGGTLVLRQERESSVTLFPQGDLLLVLPLARSDDMMVGVVEEDIEALLRQALRFATATLDHVDPTQRLTHTVLATAITDAEMLVWRTRREVSASRGSVSYGFDRGDPGPVHLTPALKTRAALRHDEANLVEDLVTLLRRAYRSNSN